MTLALALALDDQISIGFTGTQVGMTKVQERVFQKKLREEFRGRGNSAFHHGDCIGADLQAGLAARHMGFTLWSHPPTDPKKRAFLASDVTLKPKPYLKRNLDIAIASRILFVCPKEYEEQLRSGTWSTYRYGKTHRRHIVLVYPDGSLKEE